MKSLAKIVIPLIGLILFSSFLISQKKTITVFIIGDSTAANKQPTAFPETGWGMELSSFFNTAVKVDNRALNGRSTKSFFTEKRWEAVMKDLKKGDVVLIEFGHNDEKIDKPAVGTSLNEFKINLINYVKDAQSKKTIPILLTPIVRRNFKNGLLTDTHMGYPAVIRKVADSLRIPLIDMQLKTEKLVSSLGEEPSKKLFNYVEKGHVNYPDGKKDDTHLSPEGAKQVAALVAEGIKETNTILAKYLIHQ